MLPARTSDKKLTYKTNFTELSHLYVTNEKGKCSMHQQAKHLNYGWMTFIFTKRFVRS